MIRGLGQRLRTVRKALGKTQKQMAAVVGVSLRTWQDWEADNTAPGGRLFVFACGIGIDVNWLVSGIGEMHLTAGAHRRNREMAAGWTLMDERFAKVMPDDWHPVPHLSDRGGGPETQPHAMMFAADKAPIPFGGQGHSLASVRVACDSMQPEINRGDVLVFDTSARDLDGEGPFVLRRDEEVLVRRVRRHEDGTLALRAANPSVGEEVVPPDDGDGFTVLGQVVMKIVVPCD